MPSRHHRPPAVRYPVQRLRAPWIVGVAVWAGSGALLLLWWWQSGPQALAVWLGGGLLWLVVGVVWLQQWQQSPQGWLQWDGGAWWWQAQADAEAQVVQRLQLQVDLQLAVLIAWRTSSAKHSAWLVRSSEPWHWGDWRRAVYSAATVSRTAGQRA